MTTPKDGPVRYLVTGSMGCIGAWVVRTLLVDGAHVVALDASADDHRLRVALGGAPTDHLTRIQGDVTEAAAVERVFEEHGIEAVIHLAALQVPAVAAQPVLGAQVNVVGTAVILEAAARAQLRHPLAYASSIAVYDAADAGFQGDGDLGGHAATLYGVYKRANEGAAAVYWADRGVASIGLRPYIVYGPGRDFGLTSAPTVAMGAAARGEGYHVGFGGTSRMQYVEDVARSFVDATRSDFRGAAVVNLGGHQCHMRDVVAAIETVVPAVAGRITFEDRQLPFPASIESEVRGVIRESPPTPLVEGVRRTVEAFRAAAASAATTTNSATSAITDGA